jgi:hypothetical protein
MGGCMASLPVGVALWLCFDHVADRGEATNAPLVDGKRAHSAPPNFVTRFPQIPKMASVSSSGVREYSALLG